MIVVLLAVLLQDPVTSAIDRLSSDDIELREQAERDLALLGDPAARALEKLLESTDGDLAGRAKRALAMNRRRTRLPESLCRRVPAVMDRDWTLGELLGLGLTEAEEVFFAPQAARDWSLPAPTWYRVVRGRVAAASLADAAKRGPTENFKAWALAALQEVDPKSAVRLAAEGLRSASASLRVQSVLTLGDVGPPCAAGDLKRLLDDPVAGPAARIAIASLVPSADLRGGRATPPALSRPDQLMKFARAPGKVIDDISWTDLKEKPK